MGNLTAREHYKAVADTCLQPGQLQLDTSVRPEGGAELENGLAKRRGINVAARSQAGNRFRGQTISTASYALAFISVIKTYFRTKKFFCSLPKMRMRMTTILVMMIDGTMMRIIVGMMSEAYFYIIFLS